MVVIRTDKEMLEKQAKPHLTRQAILAKFRRGLVKAWDLMTLRPIAAVGGAVSLIGVYASVMILKERQVKFGREPGRVRELYGADATLFGSLFLVVSLVALVACVLNVIRGWDEV